MRPTGKRPATPNSTTDLGLRGEKISPPTYRKIPLGVKSCTRKFMEKMFHVKHFRSPFAVKNFTLGAGNFADGAGRCTRMELDEKKKRQ